MFVFACRFETVSLPISSRTTKRSPTRRGGRRSVSRRARKSTTPPTPLSPPPPPAACYQTEVTSRGSSTTTGTKSKVRAAPSTRSSTALHHLLHLRLDLRSQTLRIRRRRPRRAFRLVRVSPRCSRRFVLVSIGRRRKNLRPIILLAQTTRRVMLVFTTTAVVRTLQLIATAAAA